MTYYGGRELAASFRTVRTNTLKIAEEIPESSYGFRAADGCRTIGQTLLHIAAIPQIQLHIQQHRVDDLTKVNWPSLLGELAAVETQALSKDEIIALLKQEGEHFASYLEGLHEPFLAELVKTGQQPAVKSRLELLLSPKEHEMHHRAQLMTLQRILGLTPHLTRAMQERMAQAAAAAKA